MRGSGIGPEFRSSPRVREIAALSLGVLASLVLAACSGSNGGDDPATVCAEDDFGCVRYGPDAPVELGALLWEDPSQPAGERFRGVELALDALDGFDGRAGKILGHPVEVIAADDGCSAEGGREGASELLTGNRVVGIVGTSCSAAAYDAAADLTSGRGVVMVSPSNTLAELTAPESRQPFYFRTAANDRLQSRFVADFLSSRESVMNVLVVDTRDVYSRSLGAEFAEIWEAEGDWNERITVGEEAAVREIEEKVRNTIQGITPDAVYLPALGPSCVRILEAVASIQDLRESLFVTSDGCLDSNVLRQAESSGVELFGSALEGPRLNTGSGLNSAFLRAYRQRFGSDPETIYLPDTFDAANLIFEAVREVAIEGEDGSLSIPRTALRDALYALPPQQGLSGTLYCQPQGDCRDAATFSIFETPDWPVAGGEVSPQPVFSKTLGMGRLTG